MNTGIQDSYNLAWKLALVLKGRADQKLLDTYNEERLQNARNLLRTTDRMFQLVASPEWFLSFLRTKVLPPFAKYIFGLDAVKHFIFPIVSQIGINYRHGTLSHHAGDEEFKVKDGDRMPYFLVDGDSIYDRLHQPKFHWLVFSTEPVELETSPMQVEKYGDLIDFHRLPLSKEVIEAFGVEKTFAVLLRPDNYIGSISSEVGPGRLTTYLDGLR